MAPEPKPLPMKGALEYWRNKVPLSPDEFYALAERHRSRAFTVSGIAQADMLRDVHESLQRALSEGKSFGSWKKEMRELWEQLGWTGEKAWRLDNIFRTNIQTAYSVGRFEQMQRVKDQRPYWQYSAVRDSRTRPTHLALHGKVYPADHPFWDTFYPPNGFRCRCTVISRTQRQVRERGLTVESEDLRGKIVEPVDPVTGEKMPARPLTPDKGFASNPAKDYQLRPDYEKYPETIRTQLRRKLEGGE